MKVGSRDLPGHGPHHGDELAGGIVTERVDRPVHDGGPLLLAPLQVGDHEIVLALELAVQQVPPTATLVDEFAASPTARAEG